MNQQRRHGSVVGVSVQGNKLVLRTDDGSRDHVFEVDDYDIYRRLSNALHQAIQHEMWGTDDE